MAAPPRFSDRSLLKAFLLPCLVYPVSGFFVGFLLLLRPGPAIPLSLPLVSFSSRCGEFLAGVIAAVIEFPCPAFSSSFPFFLPLFRAHVEFSAPTFVDLERPGLIDFLSGHTFQLPLHCYFFSLPNTTGGFSPRISSLPPAVLLCCLLFPALLLTTTTRCELLQDRAS